MSFSSKKEGERFFVCKAARLQNVIWDISAHRESPDFIITENDHQFGLEVCEIFAGPESAFGSNMKREEKEIQYYITRFQQKYESISRIPLLVKFVGDLCSENMEAAFKMLVDQNFSDRPFGDHEVIEIDEGRARLRVHVTRSLHASWFSINDRVGRVDRDPIDRISDRVRAKSEKLCHNTKETPTLMTYVF